MKQKRILIMRPDRIGDVVLSTAIPREIKRTFPDSFVALYLRSYTKDIYLNNPFVDKIIVNDYQGNKISDFFEKVKELRKYKFTHALMLLPTEYNNWLIFFAGIKNRIGVGHKFYQFISGAKSVSRNKYIPLRHEADYCMDLARKIGVETENLDTEIHLTEEEIKKTNEIRANLLGDKKKLIGIHFSSGNSAPNWKEEKYIELINLLSQDKDIQILITDNVVLGSLKKLNIASPNENKNLRESILNISVLDYLISASTGPMHIAAAVRVKTISVFCPLTACSPKLWGPMGNESEIILPSENYCQIKCPGDPKKCRFEGEGGIEPNQVAEKLFQLINSK